MCPRPLDPWRAFHIFRKKPFNAVLIGGKWHNVTSLDSSVLPDETLVVWQRIADGTIIVVGPSVVVNDECVAGIILFILLDQLGVYPRMGRLRERVLERTTKSEISRFLRDAMSPGGGSTSTSRFFALLQCSELGLPFPKRAAKWVTLPSRML